MGCPVSFEAVLRRCFAGLVLLAQQLLKQAA
jgi:hypothetical protein